MCAIKCLTLEMSLKPFKEVTTVKIEAVCREVFRQWDVLCREAEVVSVLLWVSDGSEILDYRGRLDDIFEWAKYIGGANNRGGWNKHDDPNGLGLHTTQYLYTDDPPTFTYSILKDLITTMKNVGAAVTGKPIRVGATFDPGPEFAKSAFKYERHCEILMGNTMGRKSFVCCYSSLNGDDTAYAGYPDGIPDGTPFGTFFGRQCRHFLSDLGYDYIWLSNGFGFGMETWGTTGALFDGSRFDGTKFIGTQQKILEFWRHFRSECPGIPVETRGTNLTAGIDLATDGVNLKGIYEGGLGILAPPNSPWAALDGDFGLELTGFLSRIANLPQGCDDDDFLFRFYVHDPWWMNSPWADRYEGQPHDIYLPLALSRMDGRGKVQSPQRLSLLTIDNSLGEMPPDFPMEIIPHLLKAYRHAPDSPAPIIWAYPFDEYHSLTESNGGERIGKPFFEDWFMRGAVNLGMPLGSVISTDNLLKLLESRPFKDCGLSGSIIITPIPVGNRYLGDALADIVKEGGNVILYGSVEGAGPNIMELLNLKRDKGLQGELDLYLASMADSITEGEYSTRIFHDPLLSDGEIDTVLLNPDSEDTKVLAWVSDKKMRRIAAVIRDNSDWKGGKAAWLRGTNSNTYGKGAHLLVPHNHRQYFPMEMVMRTILGEFDYKISFDKENPEVKGPVTVLYRHDNGFFFSGYVPDTTVGIKFKFPLGAPLIMGSEARMEDGKALYHFPRAWHAECRVFVEQSSGIVSCKEYPPVSYQLRRRIQVAGLSDAVVRILTQRGHEADTIVRLNSAYPHFVGDEFECGTEDTPWGRVLVARGITGTLLISC